MTAMSHRLSERSRELLCSRFNERLKLAADLSKNHPRRHNRSHIIEKHVNHCITNVPQD